jgi:hypothetical protein
MPITPVEICNLALAHLGEAPITALEDDTNSGRACTRIYALARQELLRSHRWNFACKRVTLATGAVTMASVAGSGGLIQVTKTAHGLTTGQRVRTLDTLADSSYLVTSTGANTFTLDGSTWNDSVVAGTYRLVPLFGWDYQYSIPSDCLRVLELNDSEDGQSNGWMIEGGLLLTNEDTCNLVYLWDEDDPEAYDTIFVQALGLKVGIDLSEIIRGATGKTEQLQAKLDRVTAPLARRVDSNEARRRKGLLPSNSKAIQARYGRI